MRINRGQLEGLARATAAKTHVIVTDIQVVEKQFDYGCVNGLNPKV
jgi:hypothetical protein